MPAPRDLDPQRALGVSSAHDSPATEDLTGGYQPAPDTEPTATGAAGGGAHIPGYQITAEIARGGMGRVLAGRELALDREVAIKVLLPTADPVRFVTESMITAALPHPNIPPVYALGSLADGSPFLAMKYIRGRTLAAELGARHDPTADRPRFLQTFEQIANAVGFAHSRGVIHRDLKPANVMLGEFGEVQVMDWGLAREMRGADRAGGGNNGTGDDAGTTQAGTVMGTPAYMAPEQARGEPVDARADVFALGGILTAILTGKAVFAGATAVQTIQRAAAGDTADALARLNDCGADPELVALAMRCLSVDPDARPADGREVAELVAAYRHRVAERLRQAETDRAAAAIREAEQRKRRRVLAVSAAAVVAVLTAGVAVSVWQAVRATNAEAETAEQLGKTEVARREAVANERRANLRTKDLLAVSDKMVFDLQNKLMNRPGVQDLRRGLLETARTALGKSLTEAREVGYPDHTLVSAHYRMGDLERSLGDSPAAEREYRAGLALAKTLADANPVDIGDQLNLIAGYCNLGDLLEELGQPKPALDCYRQALAASEPFAKAHPTHAQAQSTLNDCHTLLGNVALRGRQPKSALVHYEKALAVIVPLADADPTNARFQHILSVTRQNLGDTMLALGNPEPALAHFRESLAVSRKLAAADPLDGKARTNAAVGYKRVGTVLEQLGRLTEARDFYAKALDVAKPVADADPTNAHAQGELGWSYERLGSIALQLGKTDDAFEFFKKNHDVQQRLADADPTSAAAVRSVAVACEGLGLVSVYRLDFDGGEKWYGKMIALADGWPDPKALNLDLSQARAQLASCRNAKKAVADIDFLFRQDGEQIPTLFAFRVAVLAREKKTAAAAATADRFAAWAEKRETDLNLQRYNAACGYALCAAAGGEDRDTHLDRALALLGNAKAAGFFDARWVARLQQDTDFDGVRGRPKFASFLKSLGASPELAPPPRPAPEK